MSADASQEHLSRAVMLLGRPWTLLIIGRLLGGPLRFNQIVASLPGISTNLLAERLRTLDEAGIVRRVPEASASSYRLTDLGGELEQVIAALETWGGRLPR